MRAVRLVILIHSFILVTGKREGFIVGGKFVKSIHKFPHVAFLALQDKYSFYEATCGSSILNQLILITAAHCLDNIYKVTASVGDVIKKRGTLHKVYKCHKHEKWNIVNVTNDIALCRLQEPLVLGQSVKRVMLMSRAPKSNTADLAGWGAVEESFYVDAMQLKHTKQKLWSNEECKEILEKVPLGTICGGARKASMHFASKGDSGSGLLIHHTIVGVVSYKDTSVSRSLVVYTDVPYFYKWVVKTAKTLACMNITIKTNCSKSIKPGLGKIKI